VPRTTKTITVSLQPEMSNRVDDARRRQGRSRSEFVREALDRYLVECEWGELVQYGEQQAREQGIGPEDVARLVEEYRVEAQSSQA